MIVKLAVSVVGVLLFALTFAPLFKHLNVRQVGWLMFCVLLIAIPWLPIESFAVGGASVTMVRQDTANTTSALTAKVDGLAAATQAEFARQQALIRDLRAASDTRSSNAAEQARLAELTRKTKDAQARYLAASNAAGAAQRRLERPVVTPIDVSSSPFGPPPDILPSCCAVDQDTHGQQPCCEAEGSAAIPERPKD